MCLWDFKDLTQESLDGIWAALDDVVMGGVSLSSIRLADSGVVFAGETSSRNSGGFCSVRTRNVDPPFNLEGYKSLRMKVRCDKGMRYKVILRDKAGWDTTAWCYSFDTQRGQWMDLEAPLDKFVPVVRGRRLRGANNGMDLSKIYSVQVMLSKYEYDGELNPNFEEGRFRLQFGPIRASK